MRTIQDNAIDLLHRDITREYFFPDRLQILSDALPKYGLIIVEAPMGYGKTTVVGEVISRLTDATACWVHLHESDLDVFWMRLCQALILMDNTIATELQKKPFPTTDLQRYHCAQLLEKLCASKSTSPMPHLILIIDDYHHIASDLSNRWLYHLASQKISNFTVVLTTRHINFPYAQELEIKNILLHIHRNQLSLTPLEIMAYYKQCGAKITLTSATAIHQHTQGWISALYLKLINYKATGDLTNHDTMHQLIGNALYLNDSPQDRQKLLALTFCEDLEIKYIPEILKSEYADSVNWIRRLSKQNAFVEFREHNQLVSVHALLRGYLKTQFDQLQPEQKREIHLRYATLYTNSQQNQTLRALHHHYLAKNFKGLMETLVADKGHSIRLVQIDTINQYFQECPREILIENPCAQLVYAMCLFTFNDMARFQEACQFFADHINSVSEETSTSGFPGASNSLCTAYNQQILGEFQLLLAFTKYNDIHAMHSNILAAQALMKGPAKFIDTQSSWTFGAPSVLYMFYRNPGTLDDTVHSLEFAISAYSKITNGHGSGSEALISAESFFNRGDFTSAQIEAHRATVKAQQNQQSDIVLCACFLQMRIAYALGHMKELEAMQEAIQNDLTEGVNYHLESTIELCDAFINATVNCTTINRVPKWIENGDVVNSNLYYPAIGFLNIVYGRLLINSGQYTKLLGEADQLLETASVFSSLISTIYTKIYMAIASAKVFRDQVATVYLKEALDLALQDQLYMPFVENILNLRPILDRLKLQGFERTHLLRIYQLSQALVGYGFPENHMATKLNLTKREYEIAYLAAKGHTNKAIGETLFISPNTVKMALKSIYTKLDIHHRSQLSAKLPTG